MSTSTDNLPSGSGPLAELRLRKPPFWMISVMLIASVATLVPVAVIARARFNTMTEPRIHIFQDMGTQARYSTQQSSTIFADGRAARPVIAGTVSREAVLGNDDFTLGYSKSADGKITFNTEFPKQISVGGHTEDFKVDAKVLARGQNRFNIYCSSCHGVDGGGNGYVNVRASEIQNAGDPWGTSWVNPANLHDDQRRARPVGHLFNTITNGIRNMGGLGHQIPPADRWAIVAYVRALQLTDNAPPAVIPQETREMMK